MFFDKILKKMASNGQKGDLKEKEALAAQQTVYDHSEQIEATQEMFETRIQNLNVKLSGITPRPNVEGEIK